MAGMPGLRGVEHIGLTVPDFDAACDFFIRVIGCEFVLDGGVVDEPDVMERQLGVDRAACCRWGFLRCGHGLNFEIFQYSGVEQRPAPKNSDIGGHHLAFYVDDFDAALAHLRAEGVRIMGEPQWIDAGPAAGARWIYFLSPWGLQLELCSSPAGRGGPDSPARKLWRPDDPAR
jgi:catechol 2,3-dioxygenase-like lactoylglutathione lyase family enzyme